MRLLAVKCAPFFSYLTHKVHILSPPCTPNQSCRQHHQSHHSTEMLTFPHAYTFLAFAHTAALWRPSFIIESYGNQPKQHKHIFEESQARAGDASVHVCAIAILADQHTRSVSHDVVAAWFPGSRSTEK